VIDCGNADGTTLRLFGPRTAPGLLPKIDHGYVRIECENGTISVKPIWDDEVTDLLEWLFRDLGHRSRIWFEEARRANVDLRKMRAERDQARRQADTLINAIARLTAERNRAIRDHDELAAERDDLRARCERLAAETAKLAPRRSWLRKGLDAMFDWLAPRRSWLRKGLDAMFD
jgi:hypothetical protein